MEFARVVRRRRMVRDYDPDRPVSPATLDALLDLALRAPSAGFTQGWGFLVLTAPGELTRFWAAATPSDPDPRLDRWRAGLRRAPVVVVPFSSESAYLDRYAEPDKGWTDRDPARWPVPYWHVDAGFAAMLLLLGAVDAGLGACFFGIPGPRVPALRSAFGVPDTFAPVGAVTLGHPAPDRPSPSLRRGRRPTGEVVHRGRWSTGPAGEDPAPPAGRGRAPEAGRGAAPPAGQDRSPAAAEATAAAAAQAAVPGAGQVGSREPDTTDRPPFPD